MRNKRFLFLLTVFYYSNTFCCFFLRPYTNLDLVYLSFNILNKQNTMKILLYVSLCITVTGAQADSAICTGRLLSEWKKKHDISAQPGTELRAKP